MAKRYKVTLIGLSDDVDDFEFVFDTWSEAVGFMFICITRNYIVKVMGL